MARPLRPQLGALCAVALAGSIAGCSNPASPAAPVSPSPAATAAALSSAAVGVPELTNVTLAAEHAVVARIGVAGGTIEGVDRDGTRYRLEIPEGALATETDVLLAPVVSIGDLPGTLATAGGVHLGPEGLALREAARLTITPAAAPDRPMVAFGYRADLEGAHRYPAQVNGTATILEIAHFSGYGLLEATTAATTAAELGLMIPWAPPDGPTDRALGELAALIDGADANRTQAANDALRRWIVDGIAPLATAFGAQTTWNDSSFFEQGVRLRSEFELWDYVTKLLTLSGVTIDPALMTRLRDITVAVGMHAVDISNRDCIQSPPGVLAHLRIPDLAHWLGWAIERQITNEDVSLDPALLANRLCVAVRFLPNGVSFPASIQPGQSGTLAVAVGLQIVGVEEVHPVGAYDVTVTPTGTDPAGVALGRTDLAGAWSRDFTWAPGESTLRLDVEACLPAPLDTVCDADGLSRGATSSAVPSEGPPSCLHRVSGPGAGHQLEHPMSVSYGDLAGAMTARAGEVTVNATTGGAYEALSLDTFRIGGPAEALIRINAQAPVRGALEITVILDGQTYTRPGNLSSDLMVVPLSGSNGSTVTIEIRLSLQAASGDRLTVTAAPRPAGGSDWQPAALCVAT